MIWREWLATATVSLFTVLFIIWAFNQIVDGVYS